MDEEFNLTPDAQAVLLLCGELGKGNSGKPLTLPQYNEISLALNARGKRPCDLLSMDDALLDSVCSTPPVNARVKMPDKQILIDLLKRGLALSTAVGRWAQCGIHVVSRADALYPKRMREHLKAKAPALLYYSGSADLFAGGGMAFVGSRDLNEDAAEAIRTVVRECVDQSLPVVSGGARGADQAAMQEAFSCGGKVIGALPCDLQKACLDPANLDALADGRALLFSANDPETRPYSYGQVAMDRNKYIYAMADACFVAQSGVSTKGKQSGTYEGAIEELKRDNHRPVFVYLPDNPSDGCVDLTTKGAIAWQKDKSIDDNLHGVKAPTKAPAYDGDLFSASSAAEPTREYGVAVSEEMSVTKAKAIDKTPVYTTPYELVAAWVGDFLCAPRDEKDLKKRMAKDLDLVAAQIKHWLERMEHEGVFVRKEYPKGKKGKVVMCERRSKT